MTQGGDPRVPEALDEATRHHGSYALKLSSGEVLFFAEALIKGDWAHLTHADDASEWGAFNQSVRLHNPLPFPAHGGLDVRLDQIVWATMDPFGATDD